MRTWQHLNRDGPRAEIMPTAEYCDRTAYVTVGEAEAAKHGPALGIVEVRCGAVVWSWHW